MALLIVGEKKRGFVPLANCLAELRRRGVVFGINTNRPWAETSGIYKKLKLNGPIVLENGAAYKLNGRSPEILVNFKARNLNEKIAKFLAKVSLRYFPKKPVVVSNNKLLLKNSPLVLISKNRRYTSSIYIRNKKGVSGKDLNFVAMLLKKKFGGNKFISFKKIAGEGKIVAGNNFYDRIKTMRYVRDRYFPDCKVFMISDDEAIRFKKDINFCAVKNATRKYKENCSFVAKIAGWRGIKYLIQKIANQS